MFCCSSGCILGCLTDGDRAEPLFPRSSQCSQGAPEHRVTWRGHSSCLMRLCEINQAAVLQCLEASGTRRNTNHSWEKQDNASTPQHPKKQPHSIPSAWHILHFARPRGDFGPLSPPVAHPRQSHRHSFLCSIHTQAGVASHLLSAVLISAERQCGKQIE